MGSPKRSDREVRATAYHEAGHAVISIALGLTIDNVSIIPGDDYNGICRKPSVMGYYTSNNRERLAIARALIVSLYAGMHAQRLVDPNPADYHGESDEDRAFELSREYGVLPRVYAHIGDDRHQQYLARLSREAGRLVKRHQRAIEKLAVELLRRKELGREEAEQIVEPWLKSSERAKDGGAEQVVKAVNNTESLPKGVVGKWYKVVEGRIVWENDDEPGWTK